MTFSNILLGSYQLLHSYVYRPLFKLLAYNGGYVSAGEDRSRTCSQKASIKLNRHFGDWPNLGAVSASACERDRSDMAQFQAVLEQKEPVELSVSGQFPLEVAGMLYRTGPAHFKLDDSAKGDLSVDHWFDGFSCLYRFQILPGDDECKVLYSSRQQVDRLVEHVRRTGKIDNITFAQKRDPCVGFFQKLKTVFFSAADDPHPQNRNSGVTITPELISDSRRLVSRTDYGMTKEIDFDTLEPIGITEQKSLHPALTGPLSCAHVQVDPITGDYFNYNLSFGYLPSYKIFRTSPSTGQTEIIATIAEPGAAAAYIHSFCLTENFVILCIPVSHFKGKGSSILWERNMLDAIAPFDPKARVSWYVVDRKQGNGVVARYTSDAMFTFHSVNAYEAPGPGGCVDIFCEMIEFPSLNVLHRLYYDNLVSNGTGAHRFSGSEIDRSSIAPRFKRYKLGGLQAPKSGVDVLARRGLATVELELVAPQIGELPTINPANRTKKARYVYTILDTGLSSYVDSLAKTDLSTGEALMWSTPKHTPGEAIFIARRDAIAEDDGYLLSVVLDGERDTSYLLCLDARDLTEVARASADVPIAIGFHGHHLAQAKL
jgi:torulene dioxygenase